MNKFITKFVNKSNHFCCTIVGKAHTYVAVSINSIGYEEYYQTLFEVLNLDYNKDIMKTHNQQLDNAKEMRKKYVKQPHVHKREAKVWALKIGDNIRKEYVDKKAGTDTMDWVVRILHRKQLEMLRIAKLVLRNPSANTVGK